MPREIAALAGPRVAGLAALLLGLLLADCAPVKGAGRPIRFDRISIDEGLSQATVTSILQDQTGFIWLGTQDGLNRYDGHDFLVFENDPEDPGSLPNSWILALAPDPAGDIWIGTRGGGLGRWQRSTNSFVSFRHDPAEPASLADDRVFDLLVDADGVVWIGTEQSGLDRFEPATGTFEHFRHDPADPDSLADDRIRDLHRGPDGSLWVATLGGLDRLDAATGTFTHFRHDPARPASLSSDAVRGLAEDARGRLWVGTLAGLDRLDPSTGLVERIPLGLVGPGANRIRTLFLDREDQLWAGTDGGLFLFSDGETPTRYRHRPGDATSLSNDRIMSIHQDRGGLMWFGVQGGGVNKWDPRSWSFSVDPVPSSALHSTDVLAFAEDAEGGLWIGTSGGGLSRLDRASGEMTHYRHDPTRPGSLSDDRVTSLLYDSRGDLWVGTLGAGLDRFDERSRSFVHHPPDGSPGSIGAAGVISLFEDTRGNLWIGTFGGGLNRFDRESRSFSRHVHDPADPASLSDDRVSAIAEDAGGDLWVGTFGGGVNHLDPETGQARRFLHDPRNSASLSNDLVLSVYASPEDTIWVGTQVGLNRLEEIDPQTGVARFRRYLERHGLPSDFIYGIQPDDQGGLWLSTNSGLSRLDVATSTFKNYDASHGLQADEFNSGAHLRSATGRLIFGGINGVSSFFPDRIRPNESVPPLALTSFSKMNRPAELDRPVFDLERLVLGHGDRFFSLEFAALDFTAPQRNRYRYMLEGFDRDWIELGHRRRVTFTNLDPGRYRLRVQGSNNDGVWNETGLAMAIVVTPPFWATWWFRSLALLSGGAALFLVVTTRTRRISRRNAQLRELVGERTRELEEAQERLLRRERLAVLGELAGSVAHELRNPLGIIKNSAYYLRLTQQLEGEKAGQHLAMIEDQIARSNQIITELLDFGRDPVPQFTRVDLQQVAARVAETIAPPETIRVEHRPAPRPVLVEADESQVRRILENLARNAVQAMPDGGTLRFECGQEGEEAVVLVSDTGAGIAREHLARLFEPLFTTKATGIGLGLSVCQRYARLNGGRIECESTPGEGATFRLILPGRLAEGDEATPTAGALPSG